MKPLNIFLLFLWGSLTANAQGSFLIDTTMNCGDTAYYSNLGFPTWNDPRIIQPPKYGYAVLLGDFAPPNLLEYQAPPCFIGTDTVVVECAAATQITCDTGYYVFHITCAATTEHTSIHQVQCNDTIYVGNLSGWGAPEITQEPVNGTARIILEPTDGAGVEYTPNPNFEGLDYVKVTSFGESYVYIFQVSCTATGIVNQHVLPLEVFPNPTSSSINIKGLERPATITLFDITGKAFPLKSNFESTWLQVDVAHLPGGLYFIQAIKGNQQYLGKVVIE